MVEIAVVSPRCGWPVVAPWPSACCGLLRRLAWQEAWLVAPWSLQRAALPSLLTTMQSYEKKCTQQNRTLVYLCIFVSCIFVFFTCHQSAYLKNNIIIYYIYNILLYYFFISSVLTCIFCICPFLRCQINYLDSEKQTPKLHVLHYLMFFFLALFSVPLPPQRATKRRGKT